MKNILRKFVAAVALICYTSTPWAQLAVFDGSNFAKNTITAAQTAQQYTKQVLQYIEQVKQTQAWLTHLQQLPASALDSLKLNTSVSLQDLTGLKTASSNLYGALTAQQQVMTQTFQQASVAGLSFNDFVAREARLLQQKSQGQGVLLNAEQAAAKNVDAAYASLQEYQAKIPQQQGVVESAQLLNTQMNTIIKQNADLMTFLRTQQEYARQTANLDTAKSQLSTNQQTSTRQQSDATNAAAKQDIQSIKINF